MGKVKGTVVKRTAKEVLKSIGVEEVTFDQAKKILNERQITKSKKMRNWIAGAMVRLSKQEEFRALSS